MSQTTYASHSADVKMWLDCGEHGELLLSRITPRLVFAKIPRDIPPCMAELVVIIDGTCICRPVNLAWGFSKERAAAVALPADDIPF